jgi:hypothetical protein
MSNANPNDGFRNDGLHEVEPDQIKPPPAYRDDRRQEMTPDTGRQGPSGYRVLIVLGTSLAAIILLWGIGWGLNLF